MVRVMEFVVDGEFEPADAIGWWQDRLEGFCGNVVLYRAKSSGMEREPLSGKLDWLGVEEVRRVGWRVRGGQLGWCGANNYFKALSTETLNGGEIGGEGVSEGARLDLELSRGMDKGVGHMELDRLVKLGVSCSAVFP